MERTISISEDVYEELLKIKKTRGFSEALMEMIKKEGNLNTLQIGFGSRDSKEKEMLKTELRKIEEEFQTWI
jgi:predicted CopG family antitoxin